MEVDGITGAVVELGRLLNVETPMIDLICALMRRRAKNGVVSSDRYRPIKKLK